MELDEDATMELKEEHEDDEASNSSDEEEMKLMCRVVRAI
jgi:hypothetical protein